MFNNVLRCLTMISESRNDWNRCISGGAATDHLTDCDDVVGIDDNSADIGNNSTEIGDAAAGQVWKKYSYLHD